MKLEDCFAGLDRYVVDDPVAFAEYVWPKEPPICVLRERIELVPKEKRPDMYMKIIKEEEE